MDEYNQRMAEYERNIVSKMLESESESKLMTDKLINEESRV